MSVITQELSLGTLSPFDNSTTYVDQNNLATKKTEDLNLMTRGKVNVRSTRDQAIPRITGIAQLPADVILLADNVNRSVKFLNIRQMRLTSRLDLPSGPWDVTCIPNVSAAVTLPNDHKVHIFPTDTTTNSWQQQSVTLKVAGLCYGIAYSEGTFVVSFHSPAKIEIIDMQGNVVKCMQSNLVNHVVFSIPHYICVATDADGRGIIFVSDFDNNTITKLSMTGELVSQIFDKDLKGPEGFAVTKDGRLVVCSYLGGNVHVLKQAGTSGLENTTQWSCAQYTQTLLVDKNERSVYISCSNDDSFIYAYNLI